MRPEGDLKSQLRRAAISVVSDNSEGSERGRDRDFCRFLYIANASAADVEAQATVAVDVDCRDADRAQAIIGQCQVVGRMLCKLVAVLDART
jgi:four helix bundle protein